MCHGYSLTYNATSNDTDRRLVAEEAQASCIYTKQGEPTTECWRDKAVCYDRCQPYRLCSEKCEHDADLCLVAKNDSDE
ncbi:hypothetical protein ScPMuIL_008388 [Solemya velum]